MRKAKSGAWWEENGHRRLANNSTSYTEKPDFDSFLQEWFSLYESKAGERGIFSRVAAKKKVKSIGRRDHEHDFGLNPCGEILLRPFQVCNLSEVIVRSEDTFDDLFNKVEVATILGTLQSTQTNFKYVRSIWTKNTEEERLLGVSLTGIMDHPVLSKMNSEQITGWLSAMKMKAIETNKVWAEKLGINPSTAITCVKPSGSVSQLCDTSSGIHPRFAPYYIRRIRGDIKDPLTMFMQEAGIPCEVDVMNKDNLVFSFPMKAPSTAVCVKDITAKEQLSHWMLYQDVWCEHNPSVTIYYKDSEFLSLGQEVYNEFDKIAGVSFLPHSDHKYQQAPYEEIQKEEYEKLLEEMPSVNWGLFLEQEREDTTTSSRELACSGGACEL